ncbi:major facilitator superfamily domain-containing protein [Cyathus striatus]|nr:major facilitator superfamily domain-containing protein [Cyathus striatus]
MAESLESLAIVIPHTRFPLHKPSEDTLHPDSARGEPLYSAMSSSSQMLPVINEKRNSTLVPKPSEATLQDVENQKNVIDKEESNSIPLDKLGEPTPPPPVHVIPDGGLRAWSTVFGAFLVIFCTFGYFNAFGVYEAYYVDTFLSTQTSSTISWIGSVQLCLQFAFGFPRTALRSRILPLPPRHRKCRIHILLIHAFTNKREPILPSDPRTRCRARDRIRNSLRPSISVINHHFFRRRALATGIVFSGSSVGGLIFPIMLNKLFERVGFVWAVRASAFLVLGLLIIANCCMSTHLPPKALRKPKPPVDIKKILTDTPYVVGVIGGFFVQWGLFFPFFYLQLFAQKHGVSETLSFYTVAILNAGSIFGRLLPNFLADKFGVMNLLIPCAAAMGILIFSLFGATNPGGVVVFSILYGFFSGGFISLLGLTFVTMADGVHEIGIRIGIAFLVIAFAALTGTPIDGALLGRDFVWYKAIIFSGVVVFVGTGLLIVSRGKLAVKKGTWRV